jgi:hypothetical protein
MSFLGRVLLAGRISARSAVAASTVGNIYSPCSPRPLVLDGRLQLRPLALYSRPSSSSAVKIDFPEKTIYGRIKKKMTGSNPIVKLDLSAAYLMTVCTNEVDVTAFFDELDIADTYYSWFLVSELHLWMLSVRLLSEECEDCATVREKMIAHFWVDCVSR